MIWFIKVLICSTNADMKYVSHYTYDMKFHTCLGLQCLNETFKASDIFNGNSKIQIQIP